MTRLLLADGAIDLRLGDWRDALADVAAVDALICDPPYSERTHAGYRSGGVSAGSISEQGGVIEYDAFTRGSCEELARGWAHRTRKWAVIFGDHITAAWHAEAWAELDWYVFAPVAWIRKDAPPRFSGDGPQRSAEWITVARPRQVTRCGSLPGYYLVNRIEGAVNGSELPGQKNLAAMCSLLRDYTDEGDVIVDPFAGTGTTPIAAQIIGARCIASERQPAHFDIARRRLTERQRRTPDLFANGVHDA